MRKVAIVLAVTILVAATAQASPLNVSATGSVYFNGVGAPPLSGVLSGETATMSFQVDSDDWVELAPGDVRGYVIDNSTFSLSFTGGVAVGLAPGTAYFCLVDGFPVSDGFFVSASATSPGGVPLTQDPVQFNLDLGYEGDTLTSLDIIDAKGVYAFDGLTRFGMGLWQIFPDNVVMGIEFEYLSIANEPVSVDESSWSRVKAMYR